MTNSSHAIRRLCAMAPLLVLGLAVTGCGSASSGGGNGSRLDVVATTTQLGDLVRVVGGDAVDVHQILKANTDPHEYEPRPSDVRASAQARLVVESGDNLDKWMNKVVAEAGGRPTVVVVGDFVPVDLPGETTGPEASSRDPHWWHDPTNFAAATRVVRDTLIKADPAHRSEFARNAATYLRQLATLQTGIQACMAAVAPAARKLVTDHDAFNYFARRFGVTVIGAVIPSQTTEAQPSAGSIARLAALIKREKVRAVFPESSINAKLAQALARQTGARSDYTLYGDTLGPPGSPGATYLQMEVANANAMVRGFTAGLRGCTVRGL